MKSSVPVLAQEQHFSFALQDISERGCGLISSFEVEPGAKILLDLNIDGEASQLQAECIYTFPINGGMYRSGMKFIAQNAGMHARMNRIVEEYRKVVRS